MTVFLIILIVAFIAYKFLTDVERLTKWAEKLSKRIKKSQAESIAQAKDFMENKKRNEEIRKQQKWNSYHNSQSSSYSQNSYHNINQQNTYNNSYKKQNNYNDDVEVKKYYKQKGNRYEYKVKCFYESIGYNVYPQGYIHGFNDRGIDLIAYKNNEVHLIQCKCYKYPPRQDLLRIFMGDCELYIQKNLNKLQGKIIHKDFVTSCKTKDYGVARFLEENNNPINYLVIEE
ncbi:hypothetical protein AVBRAN_a0038 (plasmid) [Campylobacter sp. RM12651]|nr:hypothetical protein AVBRAN_a0038 [Campylobacter sp. RM12651]